VRICLHISLTAWTSIHQLASLSFCVTPLLITATVVQEFPPVVHRIRLSASPSVPTYPERTSLPQEPLGFRRIRFSLIFSLLIPAFSLVCAPPVLTVRILRTYNAPLPMHIRASHSFGGVFSPVTFSAQSHSTSELLRTLSMVAASKPTSWLSVQLHILSHLTHTWGP
jgi:hypothetical protein